ncbi:unnamed protein product [Microthlaspi erraticum]|uniref:Uncharacterized protein n=1 Tax=Microthlaspi erraticum TaxID=1685480 RepID=A0A6D2I499_9BRAS|nr:unnamed protein product [Microthlaspi erraticum]
MMIPDSVLSSNSGFEKAMLKSGSDLSSKYGFEKSVLKSKPVISSKFVVPASKLGYQEPVLISEPVLSSKPAGSDQTLISKPGLQIMSSGLKSGSDISEKDEKGRTKRTESFEENEGQVECVLRRRVEEFINGKSRDTQNKFRDGGGRRASPADVPRNWSTAVNASCVSLVNQVMPRL